MAETDTDFTNKVSDKALRAKCEKLTCENLSDENTLKIVLGQKGGLSEAQRTWLEKLVGRRGKRFIYIETAKKEKSK